jgi:aminopeptidase N
VGEFDRTISQAEHPWEFALLNQPDDVEAVQFALESGPEILAFFEKYYDIPYPLPKMDMVAIPDFFYGGMENWGLITYASANLILDAESSVQDRANVAEVISHEIAHQWFGDLVTMDWWSDLWLNEGILNH